MNGFWDTFLRAACYFDRTELIGFGLAFAGFVIFFIGVVMVYHKDVL